MTEIFLLPKSLVKRLEKISSETRVNPEIIVREAIADRLDYLEWKKRAVTEGFVSGDRDGWLDTETVMQHFEKKRAAFVRKQSKAA